MCQVLHILGHLLLLRSVLTQDVYNYYTKIGTNMGFRRHYVTASASSRADCGGQCNEDRCCHAFEYKQAQVADNCLLSYENVYSTDLVAAVGSVTYASTSSYTGECSFGATTEPVSAS